MQPPQLNAELCGSLTEILGYLNFSAGVPDPKFRGRLNDVFRSLAEQPDETPAWQRLRPLFEARLAALAASQPAFRDAAQARQTLQFVYEQVLPGYLAFHRDLLHHQSAEALLQPFFLARVFEQTLAHEDRSQPQAAGRIIARLNDYVGYRPVPALQNGRRMEPYPHERCAPTPIYWEGVGVAHGPYAAILAGALEILRATDGDLLEEAGLDPALLAEIALDPRAYDFDHPINKRPNAHFGGWDPHTVDLQGRFRRFILQEVTLAALQQRIDVTSDVPREELLAEAAAVLAGTMLMAAGISGSGPDAYDSSVSLSTLVPRITRYREAFYERLLARWSGAHGDRLRAEAKRLRQPLGGARQHINQRLARLRATQLQHVRLAQLYAQMGFAEASAEQAEIVPVASARMLCQITGHLTMAHHALDRRQIGAALELAERVEELVYRGVECGAVADPWNLLGFGGNFPLFPAVENSVHDHRLDVLIRVLRQHFGLLVRLTAAAAAAGEKPAQAAAQESLGRLARWWDRFGGRDVSGFEKLSGAEAADSAANVAQALATWEEAGAAAGDLAFWRQHVARFSSAKAYALVIRALLERRDYVASLALLIQWVSRADDIRLSDHDNSFHELALRWLAELHGLWPQSEPLQPRSEAWRLTRRFFDFLEANAEHYWNVPRLELGPQRQRRKQDDLLDAEDEAEGSDEAHVVSAAYEGVVFRDSARDGHDGEMLESGPATNLELEQEVERLADRLAFLGTLARAWKLTGAACLTRSESDETAVEPDVLAQWQAQAAHNRSALDALLAEADEFAPATPSGTPDSHLDYDRQRYLRDTLLSVLCETCSVTADAQRCLAAAAPVIPAAFSDYERLAADALRAVLTRDLPKLRNAYDALRPVLRAQTMLYIPVERGGRAAAVVAAQGVQRIVLGLLRALPRLGLLTESYQLLVLCQDMESQRPAGDGVVTEFDRLFETGYQALVEALSASSAEFRFPDLGPDAERDRADGELIGLLQSLTEPLLERWVRHSRSLRLSVLEKVDDAQSWEKLVDFIKTYGHDLFSPRFLNPGNLRAILHQGVGLWLERLAEQPQPPFGDTLLSAIAAGAPRAKLAELLGIAIEAVLENFAEFKDFNSTTTQSDRGELLYVLLDFLRVKARYDRGAWNLRPVLTAHESLVRAGRTKAAALWRQAIAQRTREVADTHLQRLEKRVEKYGVRLPTVQDRLEERFVLSLSVDRLRALIRPAIEQARQGGPSPAFEELVAAIGEFTGRPRGAGLDVPEWLLALEEEAAAALHPQCRWETLDPIRRLAHHTLSRTKLREMLRAMRKDS